MGVDRSEKSKTVIDRRSNSKVITVEPAKTPDNEEKKLRACIVTHRSPTEVMIYKGALRTTYGKNNIDIEEFTFDHTPGNTQQELINKTREALINNTYDFVVIEANLGAGGTPDPTCYKEIDLAVAKNPNVKILIITETKECAKTILNNSKYEKINMHYINTDMTAFRKGKILYGHKQYPTLVDGLRDLNTQQATISSDNLAVSTSPVSSPAVVSQSTTSPPDSPEKSKPAVVSKPQSFKDRLKKIFLCWQKPNQDDLNTIDLNTRQDGLDKRINSETFLDLAKEDDGAGKTSSSHHSNRH